MRTRYTLIDINVEDSMQFSPKNSLAVALAALRLMLHNLLDG